MKLFISYSHNDKDFVDKLGTKLTQKRIPVFIDRWELNVGESITGKIEDAITEASFLLVVLSKSSVASQWCKREINTGLVLELNKKRVVILPVLIEDCEIPLFLMDKFHADFRTDFNSGLMQVISSVSNLTTEDMGRIKDMDDIYTDFAYSSGLRGDRFEFAIDAVQYSIIPDKPSTVLIHVIFIGNDTATRKYKEQLLKGQDTLMRMTILLLCTEDKNLSEMNAHIIDDNPFEEAFDITDRKSDIGFQGFITVKRLGTTDKRDKIYYVGTIFRMLLDDLGFPTTT